MYVWKNYCNDEPNGVMSNFFCSPLWNEFQNITLWLHYIVIVYCVLCIILFYSIQCVSVRVGHVCLSEWLSHMDSVCLSMCQSEWVSM